MELQGKKIAFLGDSITEGCGVENMENIYWNRVKKATGAEVFGYGISGTRIADQCVKEEPASLMDRHFRSRVAEMIPDADVVVVFGGTNDFGHGDAAMGTMHDRREDTFYGAYHLLLQDLFEKYPRAKVVVMTPMHRLSEEDGPYNERGLRLAGSLLDYVCAIKEVAQYYGLPVVDLFGCCPIQPKVEQQRVLYMPDGLHPNDTGHELIARCLLETLRSL